MSPDTNAFGFRDSWRDVGHGAAVTACLAPERPIVRDQVLELTRMSFVACAACLSPTAMVRMPSR